LLVEAGISALAELAHALPDTDRTRLLELFTNFCGSIASLGQDVARKLEELPPSAGYAPLLVGSGMHRLLARGVASIAVRHSRRRAKESKTWRSVCDALRFLGVKKRQHRAIFARANVLLKAWEETSIIESIFEEAKTSEFELLALLHSVVSERDYDSERLTAICAAVIPHLSLDRGPKVKAPSAAHEFLLQSGLQEFLRQRRRRGGFRSSPRAGGQIDIYVDALTQATREEFASPTFDSRPARRRRKSAEIRR
jgi:hypothetical protein